MIIGVLRGDYPVHSAMSLLSGDPSSYFFHGVITFP